MPVGLIRVRQVRRIDGVVESNAETLRVGELDVFDYPARQIGVQAIDAGVENCDCNAAAANRQSVVRPRQIVIAPNLFHRGFVSRGRIQTPLKRSVPVD